MKLKNKNPIAHASANRVSKENFHHDFTKIITDNPPLHPPHHISIYLKNILVVLGVNEVIPRRLCTKLINLLGLRGE
ncbi:MAG: hypothetical protein ACD_44C00124G0004 [uncultured bacterium]|nr:MAG: hypothetical protein ACD_44C00124G0004 [uncultured bacterium]